MERFKAWFVQKRECPAWLARLLYPHVVLMWLLIPISAALLICAFALPGLPEGMVYASYGLSAYALTVLCLRIPGIIRWTRAFRENNRHVRRYLDDKHLRMQMSLYLSVGMNIFYTLLQLGSGIAYDSAWFYALAGYYALLAVMRLFLLKEIREKAPGEDVFYEYLHYRLCGILLLVMNAALSAIVFYIVWQNRGFEHHYILTIAMAAYTFTSMTMAIINVIKYRRHESPVLSASKAISFAAALVSMLSLETSMLNAFDEVNDPAFRQLMTAATGSAVCVLVLALAVYMIVHSTKEIKRLKKESSHGEERA